MIGVETIMREDPARLEGLVPVWDGLMYLIVDRSSRLQWTDGLDEVWLIDMQLSSSKSHDAVVEPFTPQTPQIHSRSQISPRHLCVCAVNKPVSAGRSEQARDGLEQKSD
jgi:hypothetical protein